MSTGPDPGEVAPGLGAVAEQPLPAVLRDDGPFKGLAYYDQTDEGRFGGRDRDVRGCVGGILRSRAFVVYGRSGLGKTSLLLAAVFPELTRRSCRPVYVRTLGDPLGDLRTALLEAVQADDDVSSDDCNDATIEELVDRLDAGGPVVVLFDQFEEFFIRFADQAVRRRVRDETEEQRHRRREQRKAFIDRMGQLWSRHDLNLRLVFSLREDWVAGMEDFGHVIPSIQEDRHRLLPLTAFGLRQSMSTVLRRAGVPFESRLISGLVEILADVDFDPAALQVVCTEVWRSALRRCGDQPVRLTVEDLESVGSVDDIFERYLDQFTRQLPKGDRRARLQARALLDSLTTEARTKRASPKSWFRKQWFQVRRIELDALLESLEEHRLLRTDHRAGEPWYELIHERLVDSIAAWLEDDPQYFKFRSARNLVTSTSRNVDWKHDPDALPGKQALDASVGQYKDLLWFQPLELECLTSWAIFRQSKDLEHWVERTGPEVSRRVVLNYLGDAEHPVLRERAVEALGRMPDPTGAFASRCLTLTLDDPELAVRRAAGRSFGALATPQHLVQLAEGLRARGTRGAALEALADIVDARALPEDHLFGRFRLWQARRIVYERRLVADREAVRFHGRRGAIAGLLAAVGWVVTAGPLMLAWPVWVYRPDIPLEYPLRLPMYLGIALVLLLPFGAVVGLSTAGRVAKDALWTGQPGRFSRGLMLGPLWWASTIAAWTGIFFFCGLSLVSSLGDIAKLMLDPGLSLPKLILVPMALMTFVAVVLSPTLTILAGAARLAQPSILERTGNIQRMVRAWIWAAGAALTPPALLYAIDAASDRFGIEPLVGLLSSLPPGLNALAVLMTLSLYLTALSLGVLGGAWLFSALMGMGASFAHREAGSVTAEPPPTVAMPPLPPPNPRAARLSTILGLALLLHVLATFISQHGFDSVPIGAENIFVDPDRSEPIELISTMEHGFEDTDLKRIHLTGTSSRLFLAETDSASPILVAAGSGLFADNTGFTFPVQSGTVFALQPGRTLLAFHNEGSRGRTTKLTLHPDPGGRPAKDGVVLVEGQPQLRALTLERPAGREGWKTRIEGRATLRQFTDTPRQPRLLLFPVAELGVPCGGLTDALEVVIRPTPSTEFRESLQCAEVVGGLEREDVIAVDLPLRDGRFAVELEVRRRVADERRVAEEELNIALQQAVAPSNRVSDGRRGSYQQQQQRNYEERVLTPIRSQRAGEGKTIDVGRIVLYGLLEYGDSEPLWQLETESLGVGDRSKVETDLLLARQMVLDLGKRKRRLSGEQALFTRRVEVLSTELTAPIELERLQLQLEAAELEQAGKAADRPRLERIGERLSALDQEETRVRETVARAVTAEDGRMLERLDEPRLQLALKRIALSQEKQRKAAQAAQLKTSDRIQMLEAQLGVIRAAERDAARRDRESQDAAGR